MTHRPLNFPSRYPSARRGAAAVEYVLIMALVVIPLGVMLSMYMTMIEQYAARCVSTMPWPFP